MSRVFASLLLSAILFLPGALRAQEEVAPVLLGRLLVSGAPADTGTVVLHRVSPEEAGDVDSISVDADGSFRFSLPNLPIPGSGEIFLASSRFDSVLYAGSPISDPIQLDSIYEIRAYPSQTVPPEGLAFPVSRREVWVDEGPLGWQVTDVLEIHNPQSTTLVPGSPEGSVWRYPLPSGAIGARILQVGPVVGPARVDATTLTASNPVVPAENYYIVQYDLESIEFDLPLPGETGLVQLLVREPAPAIRVEGLARQPSEEIELGVNFMRWAGQSLRDQSVAVRLGEDAASTSVIWISLALAMLLVGAGSIMIRRRPSMRPLAVPPRLRKDILVEIAKLDEEHARLEQPSPKRHARYETRRAELVQELQAWREG